LTQVFIMTFLAEWGDRSQIATIALAASYNLLMVNIGALLGHFLCTGGAVQLGEWISKRVTEKQVQYTGGIFFILSGVVTFFMMFND
jgi:putative Ca2+/H+ antiporter (TMEM165/GDT1 family)